MIQHRCVADLGPVRVAVTTDHAGLVEYLGEFYALDGREDGVDWTIDARLVAPTAAMAVTRWQVGYHGDRHTRQAIIRSTDARNLAITTRKAVREVLLEYCGERQYTMLHASAVADGERLIIVVGDKGSGKTTLALDGVLTAGQRYISNDHLILYRGVESVVVTSLPTPIPVKIGTYLDYADQLGEPWENEGIDVEEYRRMPVLKRYRHDRRLLFTYRGLGQANPVHIALKGRRVVVVLASYAPAGQSAADPVPVADPMAALWPHVRFDWVFDPVLNTHHLPRVERDRDAYARDAADRLAELVAGSLVVEWRHRGRMKPLMGWGATHMPGTAVSDTATAGLR